MSNRSLDTTRSLLLASVLALSTLFGAGCEESAAGFSSGLTESDDSRRDALPDSPKSFGSLGEFELVDQDGQAVRRDDLKGSPFALAFIFTTCTGPCPVISSNMVQLQSELEGTGIGLVSMSVDPEYDTPAVLKAYAQEVGADTKRWRLLTGDEEVIDDLIEKSMYLAVGRQVPSEDFPIGMHVSHSSKLVVFDRDCMIRGYYSGVTSEGLAAARARLVFLESEGL